MKKIQITDLKISHRQSILEALSQLAELRGIAKLILFVCDDNDRVIGSLTDGDLRRALVNGATLDENVENVSNKKFEYIDIGEECINFYNYVERNIIILPILNHEMQLVDYVDTTFYKAIIPVEAVIMAGGRGKRLSPLTDKTPKPLLRVGDKPIIEHIILNLSKFGIKIINISINYLGNLIEEYLGDGSNYGVQINYIKEDKFCGTAGSLSKLNNKTHENILVTNGDVLTNVNFYEFFKFHSINQSDLSVLSTPYSVDVPYAVFTKKDNQVINFSEKPRYNYECNAGIYLLNKEILERIPNDQYHDMTQFMQGLLDDDKIINTFPVNGYWIDIGTPSDYELVRQNFKDN